MKKFLFCLAIALLAPVSQAHASNVGFNVNVNLGVPVATAYAQPVVVSAPPVFVAPPQLGFYVAVGVPYNLYYFSGRYYQSHGNVWYSSPYYNGPWVKAHYRKIPHGLRKYPAHKVHYYRDNYYGKYHNHGGREFRHFRPHHREFGRDGHGRGRDDRGRGRGGDDHGRRGGDGHGGRGR